MRNSQEITISLTPQTATSSTDATPIVVTKNSHGYSTDDIIMLMSHTTNIAANGIYQITRVNANSFSLQNRYTDANIAGTGAGAGADGILVLAPKILLVEDFTNVELQFSTASSANMTVKIAGSQGLPLGSHTNHGDTPNFGATISSTNPYSYLQMVNLDDNSSLDGSTGIVLTGTDVIRNYEVNTNGMKYICPIVTAWSAGTISMRFKMYTI